MTTLAGPATGTATSAARAFLDEALATGRCHDHWRASAGAPPVERVRSVFLMYFAARALAASGGIGAGAASAFRSTLGEAARGKAYAYARGAPPDADDTAFALRTRLLLGDAIDRRAVDESLAPFARGDSWLTFDRPLDRAVRWTVACRDDSSTVGFHPEVHLNVLALRSEVGEPALVPADLPRERGLYASYHYPSSLYATWLAAELAQGTRQADDAIDAAVLAAQRADGTWAPVADGFSQAQETALAILSLSGERARGEAGQRACAGLYALQQPDGSFPGGVLWTYRVPGHDGRLTWWATDETSVLGTSLAIMALEHAGAR